MSDVNKVRSNAGVQYGFEDTVARQKANTLEERMNAFSPDLDISDLTLTAEESYRAGYSTLRMSDGTHTKAVDIPIGRSVSFDGDTLVIGFVEQTATAQDPEIGDPPLPGGN